MNIHVEIAESCSGELLVRKPVKDITVMGFLCEFDVSESEALVDEQGRYKSFEARIMPAEASPEHHLPTACDLHSVRRISAASTVVSFRYKSPIREVQQTLDALSHAARLAIKEKREEPTAHVVHDSENIICTNVQKSKVVNESITAKRKRAG